MPYGTLQGLKRFSTSMQAAERLVACMGLHPVLSPKAVTSTDPHIGSMSAHTQITRTLQMLNSVTLFSPKHTVASRGSIHLLVSFGG